VTDKGDGFEDAVLTVMETMPHGVMPQAHYELIRSTVVSVLTLVWNRRGTVDIATVKQELSQAMGATAAAPFAASLDHALRRLHK
jgi:hypothetical protein